MEIPAIFQKPYNIQTLAREQDTCTHNALKKSAILTVENWNMQKSKHLTAIPESNTSQFEPQSLFINQKSVYKRELSVQTHSSDEPKMTS